MLNRAAQRLGAFFTACALVMGLVATFVASRPATAHAEPAYLDGYIAFGTGQEGWWTVVETDGNGLHRVTPLGGTVVQQFRYSPDGRHVAMVASGQLWVADAQLATGDVSGAHKLVDGVAGRLAWSPDGSEILFGQSGVIKSVRADGSGPVETVATDVSSCQDSDPQVTTRGYIFFAQRCNPSWSLAVRRPSDLRLSEVSVYSWAAVSADGSRLAWAQKNSPDTYLLRVGNVGALAGDDEGARYVAQLPGDSAAVAFGPRGGVVFVGNALLADGNREYRIQRTDDTPTAPVFDVTSGTTGPSGPPITLLQWVNGPSMLPSRPSADRIGGADRVDTALAASQWSYDRQSDPGRHAVAAVLARADTFPDALTGTALAIQAGGPLLLTPSGRLDSAVAAELLRILPRGSVVYLLGGTAALSPAVEKAVAGFGFNPVRLGGPDRYATALVIANAISNPMPKSVLIASGTNFPDALTAGVAAGQDRYNVRGYGGYSGPPAGAVVVLTDGKTLPPATCAYLENFDSNRMTGPWMYAVGGPAAAAMAKSTQPWRRYTSLVGADRFDTAAKVATSNLYTYGPQPHYSVVAVTTGLNFPDAMTGGALAGALGGPLLLAGAAGLSPREQAILNAYRPDDLAVVGGPAAVSPRALTVMANATFGTGAWDAYSNRTSPPLR